MKTKSWFLAAVLCMAAAAAGAEPVEMVVGQTKVSVEFYTPQTVRVVKTPAGHDFAKTGLVVTAKPGDVKVSQKGYTLSSDALTVKVDARTGAVSFLAKGKTLLREKGEPTLEPLTSGADAGKFRVAQTFLLDKDEPVGSPLQSASYSGLWGNT